MTNAQQEIFDELYVALNAALGHLDYCGFGDSREREYAEEQGLEEQIYKALKSADPLVSKEARE